MKTDIIISDLIEGQLLFCTRKGVVKVLKIKTENLYPIVCINSDEYEETYTADGKSHASYLYPSLFLRSPFGTAERVILVKTATNHFIPRVLVKIVNNRAVCWQDAKTIEESKNETRTIPWEHWKEIDAIIELTLQDISDGKGVGVDPSLIKIIQ